MQAYRKSLILTVALAAALSLVTPRPCAAQPQPPLPTDLGMLPGFSGSMAIAINANGQVVGWNSNDTTNQAFIWQNGVMTALPKPPGSDSCWAYDINASGRIAGACRIAKTQRTQASLWQVVRGAWTVTSPRIPAGWAYSMAYSINDNGEVLGMLNSSINNSGTPGGFYWEPSTTLTVLKDAQGQSIIPLQVSVGKPLPINANGQILGFLVNTGELVIWKAGAVTDLGVGYPQMASKNNNGEVVGVSNYVSFLYLPAAKYGKSCVF